MSDTNTSRVGAFLARVSLPSKSRGNLIFALDATASREQTWDTATKLQAQMFDEVAAIGDLDVQLVYFRGLDECRASAWTDEPAKLATLMRQIRCDAGETQIRKVLEHTSRETETRKVHALTFIGDSCEESWSELEGGVHRLAHLEVPVFLFQQGDDFSARSAFQKIAELTHGAYCRFDRDSAEQLAELLRAVAAFATGGILALERQGSDAAKRLLRQIGS